MMSLGHGVGLFSGHVGKAPKCHDLSPMCPNTCVTYVTGMYRALEQIEMNRRSRKSTTTGETLPFFRLTWVVVEQFEPADLGCFEKFIPKSASTETKLLTACHRPEREVTCPTRERLLDALHQEKIRRARDHEPPRLAPAID